jgi:mannose-1-phosphate guanylyltransferase/mannose-6-phosphate isomerase
MDCSQAVNRIVDYLRANQREEYLTHKRVYRTWGYYEELDAGELFRVMRIMVKPGSEHSFQTQDHRTNYWVVVSGTARITCGKETFLLSENESKSVPTGIGGRLENVGKVPLHVIEVQTRSSESGTNPWSRENWSDKE